jgi:hypothetical protein
MGYVNDGQVKITYNHFDSYPQGLGSDVGIFAEGLVDRWTLSVRRSQARDMIFVGEDDEIGQVVDASTLARIATLSGRDVDEIRTASAYNALRKFQGDMEATFAVGVWIETAVEWTADSLFCEWGYLVDLDAEQVEVYKGFQTKPHRNGRFAHLGPDPRLTAAGDMYFPIALIGTTGFENAEENILTIGKSHELFGV